MTDELGVPTSAAPAGSSPRPFWRRLSATMLGNAGFAAYQFATLLVIARLGSPSDVGVLALGLGCSAPLLGAIGSGMRLVQIRDVRAEATPSTYLVARLWCVGIATVISVLVLQFFVHRTHDELIACAVIALRASEAIADSSWSHLLAARANELQSKISLVRSALSVAVLLVVEATTHHTALAVATVTVVSVGFFLAVERPQQHRTPIAGSASRTGHTTARVLIRAALPLGAATAFVTLTGTLPRYVLAADRSHREIAIFAVISSLQMIVSLFTAAVGVTAVPHLAASLDAGEVLEFRRLLRRMVVSGAVVAAGAAIIAVLAGRPVIRGVFGPAFMVGRPALVLIGVGVVMACVATFLQDGLTAAHRSGAQVIGFGIGALVCAVVAVVLVPHHGITGAAWALAAATTVQAAVFIVDLLRVLGTSTAKPSARSTGD